MNSRARFVVQVPGMSPGEQLGLGTIMKKATAAVGLRPCSSCNRRAVKLDSLVAFKGKSKQEIRPDYL